MVGREVNAPDASCDSRPPEEAMTPAAGPLLRRVCLFVEMGFLLALVTLDESRRTVGGVPLRPLLIGGVALGFSLWATGLVLLIRAGRRSRPR
jgi:hypothetical protein